MVGFPSAIVGQFVVVEEVVKVVSPAVLVAQAVVAEEDSVIGSPAASVG